ncbi:hypothetical protein Mapa_003653 [Marchantia paleacea]|nr:hypothetical protein Mapa_003653 [Marchantia paleacea]
MERNCPKLTYSVRHGSDVPHSVPRKGKDMDQLEPKAGTPLPGVITETKSKVEDRLKTDIGNSIPAHSGGARKRKEYIEASRFDSMMFDSKRIRQSTHRSSRKETVKTQKGGSCNVDIGGGERKSVLSKHLSSSLLPPSRAAFSLYEGQIRREKVLRLVSGGIETSIASSDDAVDDKRSGGNTSTLTSNEEGDSRIISSQVSKFVGQTNNRFGRYAVPSEDDSFTGVVRKDVTGPKHIQSSGHQTSRWKQTREVDGEVISGSHEKTFSSYTARDSELNRVFGVGLWKTEYEKSTDERLIGSTMDSGCSDEADNDSSRDTRDTRDRDPDVRSLKLKQACAKYGLSNSSREHQSSSVVTDLCASSGSVSLWLEGERSSQTYRFKASALTNTTSNAKLDEKELFEKTTLFPCVQEERHTMSRSQHTSGMSDGTHPASNNSEREVLALTRKFLRRSHYTRSMSEDTHPATNSSERELVPPTRQLLNRSQYTSSMSDDTHPASNSSERERVILPSNISVGRDDSSGSGTGGSESNKPEPTFVLSSGRLSKTQAQLGKRPPTIDDDFDQYFAQLML